MKVGEISIHTSSHSVGNPVPGTTENGGGFGKAALCVKAAHLLSEGHDLANLADNHMEEYAATLSHHNVVEKHAVALHKRKAKEVGAQKYGTQPLRSWQHSLMEELTLDPDDRKIIWYCDKRGGCGKTWLTRACFAQPDQTFLNGRQLTMWL